MVHVGKKKNQFQPTRPNSVARPRARARVAWQVDPTVQRRPASTHTLSLSLFPSRCPVGLGEREIGLTISYN
jgi:hypothetical protein